MRFYSWRGDLLPERVNRRLEDKVTIITDAGRGIRANCVCAYAIDIALTRKRSRLL